MPYTLCAMFETTNVCIICFLKMCSMFFVSFSVSVYDIKYSIHCISPTISLKHHYIQEMMTSKFTHTFHIRVAISVVHLSEISFIRKRKRLFIRKKHIIFI